MAQLDAFVHALRIAARRFERLPAHLSARVRNFAPLVSRIDDFAAKTSVVFGRGFAHKLAARAPPPPVELVGSGYFRPLFDAVNVEDLVAFAVAMPRGIFRSDLVQANHALDLPGDQLLGQTVPKTQVGIGLRFGLL